ncbi:DNA-directed RNA polymerase subunit beta' [Chloroflexota bacterium]
MLEFNDFNAIRICLASPEQIRSWSYGEVTKPETINYRTLKPEKDGLFCEKIFGPTKDFECYCGKYKRIRYKGIICDKCGVEVARSKVRRERMGHVELACPVSHIWFVKGTPSRLALLLDLSPRNLEQVVYFARFIITNVDEVALTNLIHDIETGANGTNNTIEGKIGEARLHLEEQLRHLELKREEGKKRADDELSKLVNEVMSQVALVEEALSTSLGSTISEPVLFSEEVLVAEGEEVTQAHIDSVQQKAKVKIDELEARFVGVKQEIVDKADVKIEELQREVAGQIERLENEPEPTQASIKDEIKVRVDELQSLQTMMIITDGQYHDLKSKYGSVFKAGTGAEAILDCMSHVKLDELSEFLYKEIHSTSGQRRKKATKRLKVVEAFRKSGNKPQWMITSVLPVLPPELRPMVQLDGGRFATSDLNDLYRRVINRNNRLRRLLTLGAPEIIIRNEKRMLQEAVDSLIDNGRRGRAITTSSNHKLKSLSDMLRGKQGRFRQNLLGKRVDYSGRSVIIVGPQLKLHQCGLPKRMAQELFKPFVMHRLVTMGLAQNIKSAKRIEEQGRPEVWDILEEIIKERPVMLNRAPTLHRLGLQAFEPVLVEGSAIQLHPLVCTAFNADFDGDQMAVHVPLSRAAVKECRTTMLSVYNMLSPSSGEPLVAPTLDMVFGCYYLTLIKVRAKGEGKVFANYDQARLAYDLEVVELGAEISVRNPNGEMIKTTVGRIIFNEVVPDEMGYYNRPIDKSQLKKIVTQCHQQIGELETAEMLDRIKELGFHYATTSGITMGMSDVEVPEAKAAILVEADAQIAEIDKQYQRGMVTDQERYNSAVTVWTTATDKMTEAIQGMLNRSGSIYMMATSGAKGNIAQIRQMAGMRGLMTDPSGRIMELPIKASFRDGLSVLDYFISTHGARKGLADTALRTAESGYLTRRMIDVSQDVIILEDDCGTTAGIWVKDQSENELVATMTDRLIGRVALLPVVHPKTKMKIVDSNEELDEEKVAQIVAACITKVQVRSPLTCLAKRGLCQMCYGRAPASGRMVKLGEAVGVIAAQSIGEPGTQLTMRTFHTGGVAGLDITSGLPRVEELFEARSPKGQAVISEIEGMVEILHSDEGRKIKVSSSQLYRDEYSLPSGYKMAVEDGQQVEAGDQLAGPDEAKPPKKASKSATLPILATVGGKIVVEKKRISIVYEESEERDYPISATAQIAVENGAKVEAGQELTKGPLNPQDILRIQGSDAVRRYMVNEVQKIYRSQGVTINDKHIEVIVRQMLRKVRIDTPGDTNFLPSDLVDRFKYEDENARILEEGKEPATAQTVLLGVTKASLSTESFLAAASFQETTRVLTEAAVVGRTDHLLGLKENVIIGKLIPARCLPPEDYEPELLPEDEDIELDAEFKTELETEIEQEAEKLMGGEITPDASMSEAVAEIVQEVAQGEDATEE